MPINENITIGSIGCGNMGGAILQGLSKACECNLIGYDLSEDCLNGLKPYGVKPVASTTELIAKSDIIIVAVKPIYMEAVATEMLPHITADKIIISVAAGFTFERLQEIFAKKCPVVRCMPTLSAGVAEGVYALYAEDPLLNNEHKELVLKLFQSIGTCIELQESYFTAFSALIGAGPGYVFHLANALVQAGVTLGFARKDARRMVETLCIGTLRMAQQSDLGLLELRDQVCSPAGLTIEGINHLERMGINGQIVDAILAADEKARDMEKK